MTIDTNGFEIGDEVWWCELNFLSEKDLNYTIHNSTIKDIIIKKLGVFFIMSDKYKSRILVESCFHTQQECQLAYHKLNSES